MTLSRLRPKQLSGDALVESRTQFQGVRPLTRAIGQHCFLIPSLSSPSPFSWQRRALQ